MSEAEEAAGTAGAWLRDRRAQLRLGLRITVASLAAYALSRLLGLAQSPWAVLTALIVMQANVGGSLKATVDRFLGSLGGAIWGVAVALAIPHGDPLRLAVALAAGVGPLAVVAAIWPAYRVAPVTAVILLLGPYGQAGAVATALQRMLQIGLGSVVALAVALLVLPERARVHLAGAAARALDLMAALTDLLAAGSPDAAAVHDLHDRIRAQIGLAETAAREAARERRSYLAAGPDPEPLCRTLRRLHNSLVMVGRAASQPLPPPAADVLGRPMADSFAAAAALMRRAATGLAGGPAPLSDALGAAVAAFETAVADLRHRSLTRDMTDDDVGRIFALAFAIEQLRQNLDDLVDRAVEMG